jgi:hypothetical protein
MTMPVVAEGTAVDRGESVLCVPGAVIRNPASTSPAPAYGSLGRRSTIAWGAALAEIAFRRRAERFAGLTLTDLERPGWLPRMTRPGAVGSALVIARAVVRLPRPPWY